MFIMVRQFFAAFLTLGSVCYFFAVVSVGAQPVKTIDISAMSAIVMDANNGKVLYQNRADEIRAPASITKLMTLYLAFDALESGKIKWNTRMPVSQNAASQPRMKLGVAAGSALSVRDAIDAMVVVSANDAAVVMAEYLAGSEAEFARLMTLKARSLGMRNTTFKNPNGLTEAGHVSTARDIALLSIAMREHFPQYYKLFSMRQFTYQGAVIKGHNKVLDRIAGADGLKTGYTKVAGFTITTTVSHSGKKMVIVVMGGKTAAARDDVVVALANMNMNKASRFGFKKLYSKWTVADSVWRGRAINTSPVLAKTAPSPSVAMPLAYANENTAAAPQVNGFVAQVASFPDQLSATNFMHQINADIANKTLSSMAYVTQGTFENKVVFRVRYGAFNDNDSAKKACDYIKAKTYDCFVTVTN